MVVSFPQTFADVHVWLRLLLAFASINFPGVSLRDQLVTSANVAEWQVGLRPPLGGMCGPSWRDIIEAHSTYPRHSPEVSVSWIGDCRIALII